MSEYDLYYTSWEEIPRDFQALFIGMLSGKSVRARDFFQLYFYWFNVAHEVAHILKHQYGTSKYLSGEFWQEEQDCTDFAVAYWRHNHQEGRLQTLRQLLNEALSHLPDPIPTDAIPRNYFNENYAEFGKKPAKYGYFQLSFVKNGLEKELDLISVIKNHIYPNAKSVVNPLQFDYEEIDASLPPRIVEDIRQVLVPFGVTLPRIIVIKEFFPMLEFIVPEGERAKSQKMIRDVQSS